MRFTIPDEIKRILATLHDAGYQCYPVGGCVRDLVMGKTPKDWDLTTSAKPDQVIALFPKTVHENDFGMVAIIDENLEHGSPFHVVEVTTFRSETTYSDNRHPDSIRFAETLLEDLKRRDFTMNAMAYDIQKDDIIDPYNGQISISDKIITTVGNPDERFGEDALRIMRAVRFSAQLGFTCHIDTENSIKLHEKRLENISIERIRDEFIKIIMSDNPKQGIVYAKTLGILQHVSREILEGDGIEQNKNHIYDVFTHNVNALQHTANKNYPLHVRLAALFHDVGKPRTKRFDKQKGESTFYGHEVVGAKMTKQVLKRLKFPKATVEKVVKLVRHHMFFSDPDQITLSAVRRIIVNVGEDLIWDLIHVRYSDRIGMGRPKEDPYRLRKYESMIEEALRDPISVKMLKMNGDIMIGELHMKPGPRMGWILHALLEEVLDDPTRNTREYLENRVFELDTLPDSELQALGKAGKSKRDELEDAEVQKLRKKHRVK